MESVYRLIGIILCGGQGLPGGSYVTTGSGYLVVMYINEKRETRDERREMRLGHLTCV